jgi:hypothetical protein
VVSSGIVSASIKKPHFIFKIEAMPGEPALVIGVDLTIMPKWLTWYGPTEHVFYVAKEGEPFKLGGKGLIRSMSVPANTSKEVKTCFRSAGIQVCEYDPESGEAPFVEMSFFNNDPSSTILFIPWRSSNSDDSATESGYADFAIPYRRSEYKGLSTAVAHRSATGIVTAVSIGFDDASNTNGRTFAMQSSVHVRIPVDYRFRPEMSLSIRDDMYAVIDDPLEQVTVLVNRFYSSGWDPVVRRTPKSPTINKPDENRQALIDNEKSMQQAFQQFAQSLEIAISKLEAEPDSESKTTRLQLLREAHAKMNEVFQLKPEWTCEQDLRPQPPEPVDPG